MADFFLELRNGEETGVLVARNQFGPPTVNDDVDLGYQVGSRWYDTSNDREYVCLDPSDGVAIWKETTASGTFYESNVVNDVDGLAISPSDSNTVYENLGATGSNVFTLPFAGAGLRYTFVNRVGSNFMRIQAAMGNTIRVGGSVTAGGGTADATAIGDCLVLVALDGTDWVASSVVGSWTLT